MLFAIDAVAHSSAHKYNTRTTCAQTHTRAHARAHTHTHTHTHTQTHRVVGDLMGRLCMGGVDAASAAHEIALMVLGTGVASMDSFGFTGQLQGAAEDMASAGAREGALQAYK